MNVILSLILSIAVALSGGALPAVPENATVYTLGDIMISTGEQTVFLNPEFVLTVAPGAEKLQAQFEVRSGEATLLPLAGEINADGLAFSLSNNGNAYSVDAATLEALSDFTMDPQFSVVAESITTLLETYPAIADPSAQLAASDLMMDALYAAQGVTPESVELDLGEGPMSGEKVSLNFSYDSASVMLDAILAGGNDDQKAFAQSYLDLMNTILQITFPEEVQGFDSFSALASYLMEQDEEFASLTIPMDITTVINDSLIYQEATVDKESNGSSIDVYATALQKGESLQELMEAHFSEGDSNCSMMAAYSGDLSGNMNLMFDLSFDAQSTTVFTDADGVEQTYVNDSNVNLSILTMQTADEAGLLNSETTVDFYINDSSNEGSIGFTCQRNDTAEADGSITSAYYLNVAGSPGEEMDEINFALSFLLNEKQVPFTDAFSGAALTALPAETTDAEGNMAPAYQQLQLELMAPVADLMTLASEQSVMELISMFQYATVEEGVLSAEVTTEAAEADGYFITPDGSITIVEDGYLAEELPDYVYDAYEEGAVLDLEAAAEIYGSEIPAFTAPEGYTLEYLYAVEDYLSMDYGTDGTYFSITAFPMYYDANSYKALMLNDDGSLSDIEGTIANVSFNEDGTLVYADFMVGPNAITVYFDNASPEAAQAILAGF